MFLKNIVAYGGTGAVAQVAQFLQGVVTRRLLAPALLGLWNQVGVAQSFGSSFDCGITQAASRELALLHGAGSRDEEDVTRATAWWGRLLQAIIFSLVVVLWTILNVRANREELAWIAATASILLIVSAATETLTAFHQSRESYAALGRIQLVNATLAAVLLPVAAAVAGVKGLYVGAIVAGGIQVVQLFSLTRSANMPISWTLDFRILRRLLRYGIPARCVDYPLALGAMMDLLVVTRFMLIEDLAIYVTARTLFLAGAEIPTRMGSVLISRIYIKSGSGTNREVLADELRRYLSVQYLVVVPILICCVWAFANVIVLTWLPKYSAALPVLCVLLPIVFVLPQTSLIRNIWLLDGRFRPVLLSNLVAVIALGSGIVGFTATVGLSLQSIAYGVLVGYSVYYGALILTIGRELFGSRGALLLGLTCFVAMLACELIVRGTDIARRLWPAATSTTGHIALFGATLLAVSPLAIYGACRGNLIMHVRNALARS